MRLALERARRAASCLWLERMRGLIGRHGRLLRVTGAMLAALGLLSVAVVVAEDPVGAQGAENSGVGIRLNNMSEYPTHLTVDGFEVELTNLSSVVTYEVVVSSDSARVGIGGCGTASQQVTVTGVAARKLSFAVYACAVGEATVTAEVRRAGGTSPEASVSQELEVEALPEIVIGPKGERIRTTTTQGVSGQGTSEAAAQAPKVGTPGIVPRATIEFNDIKATSVRVRWGQPSSGGPGIKLTGFGLKFWKDEIQEPSYDQGNLDIVGPPPPPPPPNTPSEYTKTGLEPSKLYNFRIHACNGKDSCGYWTNPALQFQTPPETTPTPTATPGRPTAPHSIEFVTVSGEPMSIIVRWSPSSHTGGRALTRFHVRWREESAVDYPGTPQSGDLDTSVINQDGKGEYKASNLRQGIAYVIQVRSCNGGNDKTDCSDWSKEKTYSVPGTNALPAPSGLTVTVQTKLQATLTWVPITVPAGKSVDYYLERRATGKPGSRWDPLDSDDQNRKNIYGNTSHSIRLDRIIVDTDSTSSAMIGLAHNSTYEFRVQAVDRATENPIPPSAYSERVVLIDSPIYDANGIGPRSSDPRINLSWIAIQDLFPGSGYDGSGQYEFRYRQLGGQDGPSHTTRDWNPDATVPINSYRPPASAITTQTINGTDVAKASYSSDRLLWKAVYGVQFKYVQDGKPTIYAARDVYVWPSWERPDDGSRIATIPVRKRLAENLYLYRICEETFVNGTPEHWRNLIVHALDQWEKAPSHWGLLPNLITMTHEVYTAFDVAEDPDLGLDAIGMNKPCADYSTFVNYVAMRVNDSSVTDHNKFISGLIDTLKVTGLFGRSLLTVQNEDTIFAEVSMEDEDSLPHATLEGVHVWPSLARELGFSWCFPENSKGERAFGCVIANVNGPSSKADIFVRKGILEGDTVRIPGGNAKVEKSDTYLLTGIDDVYRAYCLLVHEAGHAVGLTGAADVEGQDANHASLRDSAVADVKRTDSHCSPTPFDVLAIRALYGGY